MTTMIDKARRLKNEGQIDSAISLMEDFVSKSPEENIGAHRYLAYLLVRKGDKEGALKVLMQGVKNNPANLWLKMMLGDFYYFELKDANKASSIYKELLISFKQPERSTMSPYRYILKRLSIISFEEKNYEEAEKYFELFYALEPSDFYGSDFRHFAEVLLKNGKKDKAKQVLLAGVKSHPGDNELYKFAQNIFPEVPFQYREKISRGHINGVEKIPIKTPIIKEGDDIYSIIDEATKGIREKNDIITVSSCVVAIAEERVYTVDTIRVSRVARIVSHFVSHKNVPFGGAAPLANPASMEIAIREVGKPRIILGTIAGAIGKTLRKSGWFYVVAGPQSALIDDPPAAIPPYDYSVIPGPKDSFAAANEIKNKTGLDAAIIDANDIGAAWAVGYTSRVNKDKLEVALSDNPAGNEDQQTPIVIVRGLIT
ncbi:MAG: coenzyme F420-0:L-glutamate ligase [Caldisericaceae bacterium]